jgi:hypothetical protein
MRDLRLSLSFLQLPPSSSTKNRGILRHTDGAFFMTAGSALLGRGSTINATTPSQEVLRHQSVPVHELEVSELR